MFLSRLEDLARAAEKYKSSQFTKFVSPHERVVFEQFLPASPFVSAMAWGGAQDCERCIIGFFPDFIEPCEALFPISALRIKAAGEPGHREVLGSVLGMGIERNLLGDIYPEPEGAVLFCLDSISEFIRLNLSRIGRQRAHVEETEASALILAPRQTKEISGAVSSLRLDGVLSMAAGRSRAKTQEMIAAGRVEVNWTAEENPSCILKEGDMLSVRGFGRMRLAAVLGETKKGRIRIVIKQYI